MNVRVINQTSVLKTVSIHQGLSFVIAATDTNLMLMARPVMVSSSL